MPRFTVDGAEIMGVRSASVRIAHISEPGPERVPRVEWNITLDLHDSDALARWAMAPHDHGRFRPCSSWVHDRDGCPAHTWAMWNGYVHSYHETEADACIRLSIRPTFWPCPGDFQMSDVMMVNPGHTEPRRPSRKDLEDHGPELAAPEGVEADTAEPLQRSRRGFWA